ncbi:MAG: AAA family ATPase [Dehalococcoidales bacterium]|nr:MAG: AAA family ATPase [Dehalococcoidales bacterium]
MNREFEYNLDHLLTELKRIDLKLRLQVVKLREEGISVGEDKLRGLYVSEGDIDAFMGSSVFNPGTGRLPSDNSAQLVLAESLKRLEVDISRRKIEGYGECDEPRLAQLQRLFGLSAFEVDTLLVCLLPELDLSYQRLYGYLQDDVTKSSPTVDLVLHLLCESFEQRVMAREAFIPEAALVKNHLLRLSDDTASRKALLLNRSLQVDERVIGYLLGAIQMDARLLSMAGMVHPEVELQDVVVPDDTRLRLAQLAARFKETGLIGYLRGGYGVGKQTTAEALCRELGLPLLKIDIGRLLTADIMPELAITLIFREGLLQNAAIYFDNFDAVFDDESGIKAPYDCVISEIEKYPGWVFMAGEKVLQPRDFISSRPLVYIEFPVPSYAVRQRLWERQWNGQSPLPVGVDFGDLAGKFRLSGGQIGDAAAMARNLALWREPGADSVTEEDLYLACRQQFGQRLNTLASKLQSKYDWGDIVLPRDKMMQLSEICSYVEHYHKIYENWGFGNKHSRGKGLSVLFAGPSGTGKTMAAEIMANRLGLDLYRIDLSTVVSKYIGETEKNLDHIFREGQPSNAILFFDEADAIFGKRSEVRDSHDRYANIEIAYLLQKIEEYEGVVILATNLHKNIDEAFARRMKFTVEFPMPDEADRYRIWQKIFPEEAPLSQSADLSFLARQFRISGGNIKNIALAAAFLAAENGGDITMETLIRATKREYQKIGRLCTESEFGQYFKLVKT